MFILSVIWFGVLLGLLITPRGRARLARFVADIRHVLGFGRLAPAEEASHRWHELAAEDARDPALRRTAAVKDAYVAGKFDYDELEWRVSVALMPPEKAASCRKIWRNIEQGPGCLFRELHAGGGYLETICDCGHSMNQHYNGGCNDCDRYLTLLAAPPKPSDSARTVRPARQSHG